MDNLVLLSQGTSTAHPAFNANFYVTAATIIPVLYLVLAVQETTFQRIVETWQDMIKASRTTLHHRLRLSAALSGGVVVGVLVATAFGIVIAGGLGELLAVYALYQGQIRAVHGSQSCYRLCSSSSS